MALYLLSIAEMNGIDLQTEIEHKIRKNQARVYERDPDSGVMRRVRHTVGSDERVGSDGGLS